MTQTAEQALRAALVRIREQAEIAAAVTASPNVKEILAIANQFCSIKCADAAHPDMAADYDPTPYCLHCGPKRACDCGPIAENN